MCIYVSLQAISYYSFTRQTSTSLNSVFCCLHSDLNILELFILKFLLIVLHYDMSLNSAGPASIHLRTEGRVFQFLPTLQTGITHGAFLLDIIFRPVRKIAKNDY